MHNTRSCYASAKYSGNRIPLIEYHYLMEVNVSNDGNSSFGHYIALKACSHMDADICTGKVH